MIHKDIKTLLHTTIERFLSHSIDIDLFCAEINATWIELRDEQDRIRETWDKPYDQLLIDRYTRQEISNTEFADQYKSLFGDHSSDPVFYLVNEIHSLCPLLYIPNQQDALTEEAFIKEVAQCFLEYQTKIREHRESS